MIEMRFGEIVMSVGLGLKEADRIVVYSESLQCQGVLYFLCR